MRHPVTHLFNWQTILLNNTVIEMYCWAVKRHLTYWFWESKLFIPEPHSKLIIYLLFDLILESAPVQLQFEINNGPNSIRSVEYFCGVAPDIEFSGYSLKKMLLRLEAISQTYSKYIIISSTAGYPVQIRILNLASDWISDIKRSDIWPNQILNSMVILVAQNILRMM